MKGRWSILTNRVAELRKARGLGVDQLAVYCGVSRTTIAKLEKNAGYVPDGKSMVKLAQYFDLPLHEVFYLESQGSREAVPA